MQSHEFLEIRYDAFFSNNDIEDFDDIELFKQEINANYSSLLKANGVGRGEAAYEFIIHFLSNISIEDYLKIISLYLAHKALDKDTSALIDRYMFVPLIKAYNNLRERNKFLDCHSFKLEFQDVTVCIYKTAPHSLLASKSKIIEYLASNFANIKQINGWQISEIHIPVVKDNQIFRVPLGESETINTLKSEDYFKYWGLKYLHNQINKVYNLQSRTFIEENTFYSESEFEILQANSGKGSTSNWSDEN